MKLPALKKWEINPETEGLLFFAQALDEMLFHHSLDSFKAPALNAHSNILELLFFAFEFGRGNLRTQKSFAHVIEELEHNLKNDPVVENGDRSVFTQLLINIKNASSPRQFANSVQALHAEFEHNYWIMLKRFLLDKVPVGKEKESILLAVRSFCVEAELIGYSREFLYRKNQDFFFSEQNPPNKINDHKQLEEFLNVFHGPPQKFIVFIRANVPLIRYEEHLKDNNIFVSDGPSEELNRLGTARLLKKNKRGYEGYNTYIKIQDVVDLDPLSARDSAESRLRMFYDAYTFLDHKTTLVIHPSSIIISIGDGNRETFLRARPHPMEKASSRDLIPHDQLNLTFNSLFNSFTSQATHQLFRVFDYHSAAISTDAPESQLISLWAALEGLFPPPEKGTKGISHYMRMLLPALVLTYSEKIFNYLSIAIKHAGNETKQIIEDYGKGESFFEKVVQFIVSKETGDKANELTKTLSHYPLLRNRCFWCHSHFSSSKNVYQILEAHRERLSWHLRRIYLARNQILHNDRTLPYLTTLVENLHSYLDIILRSIIKLGSRTEGHQMSITTAFEILEAHEKVYLNTLRDKEIICDDSNFKEILFGRSNPLSPFSH